MNSPFSAKTLDFGEAMVELYYFAKKQNFHELREHCAKRLADCMESWYQQGKDDKQCMARFKELKKKSLFLLFERSAFDASTFKARIHRRVAFLIRG